MHANISHLFNFSHFDSYVVLHHGFKYISLMRTDRVLFIYLLSIWIYCFLKYLCNLGNIFIHLSFSYWYLLISFFLICSLYLGYKSFYGYMYCEYLLPLCKLPFHSYNGIFRGKVLSFNEVTIYQNIYIWLYFLCPA